MVLVRRQAGRISGLCCAPFQIGSTCLETEPVPAGLWWSRVESTAEFSLNELDPMRLQAAGPGSGGCVCASSSPYMTLVTLHGLM